MLWVIQFSDKKSQGPKENKFFGPHCCYIDYLTASHKSGDGLNAGMSCAGTTIVVFFEMLRAVFSLRYLIAKVPYVVHNITAPLSLLFLMQELIKMSQVNQ